MMLVTFERENILMLVRMLEDILILSSCQGLGYDDEMMSERDLLGGQCNAMYLMSGRDLWTEM